MSTRNHGRFTRVGLLIILTVLVGCGGSPQLNEADVQAAVEATIAARNREQAITNAVEATQEAQEAAARAAAEAQTAVARATQEAQEAAEALATQEAQETAYAQAVATAAAQAAAAATAEANASATAIALSGFIRSFDTKEWLTGIAWSTDGQTIAASSLDGILRWRASDGSPLGVLGGFDSVANVRYSQDGQYIMGVTWYDLQKWRVDGEPAGKWSVQGGVLCPDIRDSDDYCVISWIPGTDDFGIAGGDECSNFAVRLYHALGDESGRRFAGAATDRCIRSITFSPDGQFIAVGDFDGRIAISRISPVENIRILRADAEEPVYSIAWSPNGEMIAATNSKAVYLWRANDGELIRSIPHETDTWFSSVVSFSPDGQLLAAGGRQVRMWRISDGEIVQTSSGPDNNATDMAWSPDGKTLATMNMNKVQLWRVPQQ